MSRTDALSAVFSNLAKASEKQQFYEDAERYGKLAGLLAGDADRDGTMESLRSEIARDIEDGYPALQAAGGEAGDRGVLRAVKWGEKVTTSQRALVDRFATKGEELLEGRKLFVCEACGFIYLGDDPPEICPVCKAPSTRFSLVR